ncbi:KPN_02809 family neutral zinc metallopeptidase [Streptococcus merionis]|uniref:Neutral zinc metallopeptidase n=1 Tax=Streptococcus merionis TaxID=400065 RepID=A0A239SPG7_9STRE|nr:neutral zinc metallopeptidase [Streptococcus merionis]SNU87297.1 neutral zinc metallopeptidase [Streptococcus merionis]
MKIDDLKKSNRVEDRRGQGSTGGGFGRSTGGGGLGTNILLQLLLSSGRGKWLILGLLLLTLVGGGSGLGNLFGFDSGGYSNTYQEAAESSQTDVTDDEAVFLSKVFQSTEDFWTEEFARNSRTYNPPTLVLYSGRTKTACGLGDAATGPFYCPGDKKVYIDLSFYRDLTTKYNASGDFAMAYVIAHEVGHHVQTELGTMTEFNRTRQQLSEKKANALTVRLELQADYYAGAWAKYVDGQGLLEAGDIDEAMAAAHAVGDDTLQEKAYGRVVPDSFTHGTSEQRRKWFDRGYQYGDLSHGDTFSGDI